MQGNDFPLVSRVVPPLLCLSLISNLAILISPLFMMQLLDRVIPSGNMATLLLIGGLALAALGLQALVEAARDLSLARLSRWCEQLGTALVLRQDGKSDGPDQQRLVEQTAGFSKFLGSPSAVAALSLPWLPIFLLALWLLHPAFLILLAVMATVFMVSTSLAQTLSQPSETQAAACARMETKTLSRAEQLRASLGMAIVAQNLRHRFAEIQKLRHAHLDRVELTRTSGSALTGLVRNSGQIAALALGAWLVTMELMSAGGMIAGSIITSKAYMSIEQSLTHFPRIRSALADYFALTKIEADQNAAQTQPQTPSGALRAEGLIVPRGGGARPRLDRVSLALKPGECLAIVGNSGSGKSTLLRALAGIEPSPIGSVFLDDSEIRGLSAEALHQMVGYLPQLGRVTQGTIAENISYFDVHRESDRIIDAAKTAGVHGLISALPNSFETDLEAQPHLLSAGQAQRVALARAIYTAPRYLFLDEPNALLDADGERALGQTLHRLKQQGTTIVMVVHRSGILQLADKILHLDNGRMSDFGNRRDVMHRLGIGGRQIDIPLLATSAPDARDWVASHFTRATDQEFSQKAQILCSELLQIGCDHTPPDTLLYAKFTFRFMNDTRCQIVMTQPVATDLDEKVKILTAAQDRGKTGLSADMARITRVMDISDTIEVACDDAATRFQVVLSVEGCDQTPAIERKVS